MNKQWVIADVHGCYETLVRLVEEKICPNKKDEIYLLGDYIDRGPNSKAVIDYIIYLQDVGYPVTALKGNHEDVFLRCYSHEHSVINHVGLFELKESWLYFGGKATLRSFGVKNLADVPGFYINYLDNLPCYHKLSEYILVHAGLNCSIEDPFSDELSMLWIKNFNISPEKTQNRRIIHGHVPHTIEEIQYGIDQAFSFSLDNGCVYQKAGWGNLLALELNSLELMIQENVDYQKKTAKSIRLVA
ncbi:MAG: metallophosphoesterase [Bacteroidota bacterium]